MDAHLFTKIIHMSAVSLLLVAFVARAATLFVGMQNQQPNPVARKVLVALQHLSLTLLVITGVILLFMKSFNVQPWFYAKVILFVVLCSALIKTYKNDTQLLLVQRRAGLLIATVALIAILGLVIVKPVFV